MITRRGIGFVATAIAVFFVASATRVGWLYVADALLWGVTGLSALLPHVALPGMRGSRRVAVRRRPGDVGPVPGDRVAVELALANPSIWPRYFISASHEAVLGAESGERRRFFFARIDARGGSSASCQVECRRRGEHSFGPVTIESRAPFGLFRRRRRLAAPLSLVVYPRWFQMRTLGLLDGRRGDTGARRRSRRGDEILGGRRYVIGDSLRDIHWKNTARRGSPTVKEYDAGAQDSLLIAFGTAVEYGSSRDASGDPVGGGTLEYAISLAASAGRVACLRGDGVRLAIDGSPGESFDDWSRLMQRLAIVTPSPDAALSRSLDRVPDAGRLFAIVSPLDRGGISKLAALARRGASIGVVLLEGFEHGDDAGAALAPLNASGCAAVVCRRGAIEAAVSQIEAGLWRPARPGGRRVRAAA